MDFIEAIKTRKKIRRPHWKIGYWIEACDNGLLHDSELIDHSVFKNKVRGEFRPFWTDMIATDWEVVEDSPKELVRYLETRVTLNGNPLFQKVVEKL